MIGSVSSADTGAMASSVSVSGGRSGSGAFADALREAERGVSRELSAAERDELWSDRIKRQREVREDPERLARAQEGAEQLVASTFIVPILQELRESNQAAPPFGPGMHEKRFGPMLDAQVADRIVRAQGLGIVDAVRNRMLGVIESRVPAEDEVDDSKGAG
jgi:Rod binding domain-containing protein